LQRVEIDRCSVHPEKRCLFDHLAVIPGDSCVKGQCGRARPGRGLETSHAVVAAIDGYPESTEDANASI